MIANFFERLHAANVLSTTGAESKAALEAARAAQRDAKNGDVTMLKCERSELSHVCAFGREVAVGNKNLRCVSIRALSNLLSSKSITTTHPNLDRNVLLLTDRVVATLLAVTQKRAIREKHE